MTHPPRSGDTPPRTRRLEMLLFLAVCAVGIYALGGGMQAVTGAGSAAGLAWLAIAVGAMWILFAQMGRVHSSWPRRPHSERRLVSPSAFVANPTIETAPATLCDTETPS